jgi:hypothetical protein
VPLLVCPPLSDVLPRCFPYTTLNNLDFLNVKGYVGGSTNPIFESHPEWWDVLMDIDTGKVLVSTTGANGKPCCSEPKKLDEMDAELMEQAPTARIALLSYHPYTRDGRGGHGAGPHRARLRYLVITPIREMGAELMEQASPTLQPYVLYAIEQVSSGMDAHYSEYWLRACFQEHAQQLLCARRSRAPARPQAGAEPSAALISHHLEQLRAGSKLSDRDMLAIFGDLLSFVSLGESKLVELLSMVPGSSPLGCLAPAACGRDVCLPGCNKPPGARQARPEEAQGSAGGGRARGHCLVARAVFSSTPPRDVGHFAAQPPTAAALVDLRLQP